MAFERLLDLSCAGILQPDAENLLYGENWIVDMKFNLCIKSLQVYMLAT
jgi:hypothetical protein